MLLSVLETDYMIFLNTAIFGRIFAIIILKSI